MMKKLTKLWIFAVLTVIFTGSFCLSVRAAETSGKSLSNYTDEEVQAFVKTIKEKINELKSTANTFQSKLNSFKSTSYTYQLSETEARRRAQNRQEAAEIAAGELFSGLVKDEEERYQKLMNNTYKQNYDDFLRGGGKLKWTNSEEKIAQQHGISLDGINFSDTGIRWDKVINRAQSQAIIERNPANGANKAVAAAEELDDIKTELIEQQEYVKVLLMGLNPASNITQTCTVQVAEGETCPADKLVYTVTDPKGRATSGASKGCTPLPIKYAEIQACILCPLFQVILRTDQTIATKSFGALASSFRNVIIMVLALFIAYQTLITVSAFTKQDAPKYISTLLVQAFKVLLAALFLSNSTYVYQYIINPLMATGLEFGLALLFDQNLLSEFNTLTQSEKGGMPNGVIGQDLLASVMAAVKLFSKASAQMPAIGSSLICISRHEAGNILPDFSMLIEGVLVFAFGWCIALACCFYLLDSVVRFGIFCALLPFLIACWPFKVTASYTKTGWDIFMNAFFNFVMMGMIISINSELISQALTGGRGGMDALEAAINGSNVDTLKDMMDISGVDFLVLVACCMFAFKLVEQINDLAGQVSSTSGGTGIGNKIGGAAAQAAKKVAGTAAKGGKAVVGGAAGVIYEGTNAKAKVEAGKAKIMSGLNKVGAKIGLGNKANPNGAGGSSEGGRQGGSGAGGGNSGGNSGGDSGGGNPGGGGQGGSGGGSGNSN